MNEKRVFPGTTIKSDRIDRETWNEVMEHIFAGGNIYRSQVTALTGIDSYSVQNWVSRGFVSRAEDKQYSRRQLSRLIIINMLSDALQIGDITAMLSYVNGDLSDEGDDMIPDDVLYGCFAEMCSLAGSSGCSSAVTVESAAAYVTDNLPDLRVSDREKLAEVLCAMYYAFRSAEIRKSATGIIEKIKTRQNSRTNAGTASAEPE